MVRHPLKSGSASFSVIFDEKTVLQGQCSIFLHIYLFTQFQNDWLFHFPHFQQPHISETKMRGLKCGAGPWRHVSWRRIDEAVYGPDWWLRTFYRHTHLFFQASGGEGQPAFLWVKTGGGIILQNSRQQERYNRAAHWCWERLGIEKERFYADEELHIGDFYWNISVDLH